MKCPYNQCLKLLILSKFTLNKLNIMRKALLLIFTINAFMNLNAQDIISDLVFHLDGNETIATGSLTSSDVTGISGVIVDTDSNVATITHSTGADGTANGAFNIPVGSFIQFAAGDITNLPVGGIGSGRTYSAWVKGGALLTGNVLAYGNKSSGEHMHFHLQDAGTTVFAGHWSFDWKFTGVPNYADGAWHHIAYKVYQGTSEIEIELFVDGVSRGTLTQTNGSGTVMNTTITEPGLTNLTIGQRNGGATDSKDLVGELDDIRIYNRALTTADIQALYVANSLSLTKFGKTSDFEVFPTITSDLIEVSSKVDLKQLNIVNLNGITIRSIKANELVNVSNLSSGLYFIVGESANGFSTIKFLKK